MNHSSNHFDGARLTILPTHDSFVQRLAFDLPAPDAASVGGVVNNNKTHHPFTFNGIFEMDATQVGTW